MDAPREQEQSIKDRKKLIYDDDPTPISAASAAEWRPFAIYLRETPPQPLSLGLKAALWAAGIVVLLLLAGALYKTTQPKAKPSPKTGATPAKLDVGRDQLFHNRRGSPLGYGQRART